MYALDQVSGLSQGVVGDPPCLLCVASRGLRGKTPSQRSQVDSALPTVSLCQTQPADARLRSGVCAKRRSAKTSKTTRDVGSSRCAYACSKEDQAQGQGESRGIGSCSTHDDLFPVIRLAQTQLEIQRWRGAHFLVGSSGRPTRPFDPSPRLRDVPPDAQFRLDRSPLSGAVRGYRPGRRDDLCAFFHALLDNHETRRRGARDDSPVVPLTPASGTGRAGIRGRV